MTNKKQMIVGWILSGLAAVVLLFSVSGKLFLPDMQGMMKSYGLGSYTKLIAAEELISTILFLVPRTNKLGVLLLTAHLGGATVIHLAHQQSILMPTLMISIVWLSGFLRNPKWLASH